MHHSREEIEAAVDTYLSIRNRAIAGECEWTELSNVFTEDAEFVDSVWGRHVGLAAVTQFLADSMSGMAGWSFPHYWQAIDGDRVVLRWSNVLPGEREDGSKYEVMGVSLLAYAGDGKFCFEEDLYSESNLMATMRESRWHPPAEMVMPPDERSW